MEILSLLNIYGAVVLVIMMVFYAIENRAPVYTLLFAVTCMFSSAYGFLAGTWPFGVIEIAWTVIALRRYNIGRKKALQA